MMLTWAKAPYSVRTWTSVNTMDNYRRQLGYLDEVARAAGQRAGSIGRCMIRS
jgi:hypothetical protein